MKVRVEMRGIFKSHARTSDLIFCDETLDGVKVVGLQMMEGRLG
jgi:hypothetical protein